MKLGETGTVPITQPVSTVNTENKSNKWTNPIILWIVIGILLLIISYGAYYIITRPSVEKIQKEADAWKSKYELVLKEYQLSKNVYENTILEFQKKFDMLNKEYAASKKLSSAKISEIQKKFDKMKKEFDRIQNEGLAVQKPKNKKERVERLRALGYEPIMK